MANGGQATRQASWLTISNIGTLIGLAGTIAVGIWSLANAYRDIEELQGDVTQLQEALVDAEGVRGSPGERGPAGPQGEQGPPGERGLAGPAIAGMVVASTVRCNRLSGDWESYGEATGRFIVGAGSEPPYRVKDVGGHETVRLTLEEMPRHRHIGPSFPHDEIFINQEHDHGIDLGGMGFLVLHPREPFEHYEFERPFRVVHEFMTYEGNNEGHNNLPPYIALYWCTPSTAEGE